MKLLFHTTHGYYLRMFDSAITELARRGHDLRLLIESEPSPADLEMLGGLAAAHPGRITWGRAPSRKVDEQHLLARDLRACVDALRYYRPEFEGATSLRDRALRDTPARFQRLMARSWTGRPAVAAALAAALDRAERAVPRAPYVAELLRAERPDVLLLTPAIWLGRTQVDYQRAAQALGVRTVLCVCSWDNLSSKALILDPPDLITVWNEVQRREAMELHGLSPERIAVTGAQAFDHWFGWPARPREEFCRRVGLHPARPYVLWVGTSTFGDSVPEPDLVRRWLAALRSSSDPRLREVGVMLRPHPRRTKGWEPEAFAGFGEVVVWPRTAALPQDRETRQEDYDSLTHSAVVAGVNTSAFIEAAIVGRPVLSLVVDEMADSQSTTLHFKHLREVGGGLLEEARSLPEHVAQLSKALGAGPVRAQRFLEAFIRPAGLDVPASPRFADAIEGLGRRATAAPAGSMAPMQDWLDVGRRALHGVRRRFAIARGHRPEEIDKVRSAAEDLAAAGPALREALGGAGLKLVDVGARGGALPQLEALGPFAHYVACEPDQEEARTLPARLRAAWRDVTVFTEALATTEGRATLRICGLPGHSSLLEPDLRVAARHYAGSDLELFKVVRTIDVPAISLARAAREHGFEDACFLKLDTQGTELDIMRSGRELLTRPSWLGVHVEVEFQPFYVGQPLFADVDAFLRELGFSLFDLQRALVRRASSRPELYSRRQVVWAHALYLREPTELAPADPALASRLLGLLLAFQHHDAALDLAGGGALLRVFGPRLREDLLAYVEARTRATLAADAARARPDPRAHSRKDRWTL